VDDEYRRSRLPQLADQHLHQSPSSLQTEIVISISEAHCRLLLYRLEPGSGCIVVFTRMPLENSV
jgi:hypothetical protein